MLFYNGQPLAIADERTVIVFLENELAKFLGKANLEGDVLYGPPAGSNRHF